jgi:FtsH-binding integral membrane protein
VGLEGPLRALWRRLLNVRVGALSLYLDFINLFLFLPRVLGDCRE